MIWWPCRDIQQMTCTKIRGQRQKALPSFSSKSYEPLVVRRIALSAHTCTRHVAIVRRAVAAVAISTPLDVRACTCPGRATCHGTADDCTCAECCERIPETIRVTAIAGAAVAEATMTLMPSATITHFAAFTHVATVLDVFDIRYLWRLHHRQRCCSGRHKRCEAEGNGKRRRGQKFRNKMHSISPCYEETTH